MSLLYGESHVCPPVARFFIFSKGLLLFLLFPSRGLPFLALQHSGAVVSFRCQSEGVAGQANETMSLKEYGFVKEFGEGIDRMCKELEDSGLPDPDYQVESFMLRCIVRGSEVMKKDEVPSNKKPEETKRTSTT